MLNNIEVELEFFIKSYNIDAAGHVNNAVYINWLEDLRTLLIEKIITKEILLEKNLHLVVASTKIEYKKPLHLYEKPLGKMRLEKYERGILHLTSLITLNNKIVTRAFQKCVLIDKSNQTMIKENLLLNF